MNHKRRKVRGNRAIALAIIGITILATLAILPASAVATNDISVTYRFDESEILSWLDTGEPMKNLRVEEIPGEPLVPYRIARILLPPYTDVANVSVQATFGGQHVINNSDSPCGQPACVIGEEPTIVEKNSEIYDSDELYPGIFYRVGVVVSFRGYNVLHVRLYPVQYKPASNLAMYYTEMTVQVTLNTGYTMDFFRSLAKDRQIAENLVDNPWTLITYDNVPATIETHATTYEYLIITKAPLSDEFQVLADWKANWVDGAKVETVSANASAEEIKNIINYTYTHHGTSYVLLGGDVRVIPIHNKTVSGAHIAEDYWFANLVGDDDISYYEVYIGRAPVDNETEAAHFVNKVITFEQMDKPKANLFHQSRLEPGNVPDSRELAWQCQQYVPEGYTNYELFEENGRIEKTDWRDFWRNDGIMCQHFGHGWPDYYVINYEVDGGEVLWYDTDVPSMDNTFWPLHTSVACFSGLFWAEELESWEFEDCLAEAYVKADNGAIACLMNYAYGWYSPNDATMYSGDFVEMQFHALYQEGCQNIGAILARSKDYFIDEATDPNNPIVWMWEWCWREINLIGDPETPMLTKRALPVGYWRFNEGDGSTARDSSSFGNDGTIRGADWTAGRTGYALSFDGLLDYVKVPDSDSLDITDEITIAAWVNLTANHATSMATMIRKQGSFSLELGDAGNNRLAFKLWFTDGTEIRLDGPEIPKFEWHHLAATYDGSTMKLYIDGNMVANCSVSKSIVTGYSSLKIGCWGIEWFKGIIDEVRIYDLALPAEEIWQIVHGKVYYLSTNNIRIVVDSTAHDDPWSQTHALTIDNPIPKEFWTGEWYDANPDAIIGTADGLFHYEKNVSLSEGRHVLEYAVSNYVGYWHTTITINGLVVADENTDVHNHIYVEFYIWPADIDGDGHVGPYDLGYFSDAYGSKIGDPNYNPRCDFMGDELSTPPDGDVDADDCYYFTQHYGKSYT